MGKKNKKKTFSQSWSNQTALGDRFGISAIAVGKLLIEAGLKDPMTKLATETAIKEGYAFAATMKDGTPYYMWHIDKVRSLIAQDHRPLNKVDFWVNEVRKILRDAEREDKLGNDKIGSMMFFSAFDDVPKNIKNEVRLKIKELIPGISF